MGHPRRILIAELPSSDVSSRATVTRALEDEGHRVDVVTSAADVLATTNGHPADVAILDADLEGMDDLLGRRVFDGTRVILNATAYENQRIIAALQAGVYALVSKSTSASEVLWAVHEALNSPRHGIPALEVLSAREAWIEVLAPCSLPAEERLLSFLTRLHQDIPEPVRDAVNHALRELLTNAVEWGGQLDPDRHVRVTCVRGKRLVLYRIADPGPGFRLDALPHAAVNNPADRPLAHAFVREAKKIRPGGFGISLVRGMVDELTYNEAHNEVIFVKYLPESGDAR